MGKHAQYIHRGGAPLGGTIPAPLLSDFSITNITQTTADVNRLVAVPFPADRWERMAIIPATGAIAQQLFAPGTPGVLNGLTANTTYRVVIRWRDINAAISDWSPPQTFTTLP